jgi:hypothetical protein
MLEYYGGKLILNQPVSLAIVTQPKLPEHNSEYAYSLSCWLNFDAVSRGYSTGVGEYTTVMVFRENLMITYNAAKNRIRLELKNPEQKVVLNIDNILLQTWNNLMFIYSKDGVIDLFWNGELHSSANLITNYTSSHLILGSHHGIQGKICNILLYQESLSPERIRGLYTHALHLDPPVS